MRVQIAMACFHTVPCDRISRIDFDDVRCIDNHCFGNTRS